MCKTAYEKMLKGLSTYSVPLIKPAEVNEIPCRETVLLDIRSEKEYSVSHIPGALFYDYDNFNLHQLGHEMKEKPVILYCTVGYRSEKAGESLLRSGFVDVYNLYGGIFQWVNEGFPIMNLAGKRTDRVHTYNKKWSEWLLNGEKVYE